MRDKTLGPRVIAKAVKTTGSEAALARRLRVPLPTLQRYLAGTQEVPDGILLRAVDLVLDDAPADAKPRRSPARS